jgi:hypothetical protein
MQNMTAKEQNQPDSPQAARNKSEYLFVTSDYRGREGQFLSLQRFQIGKPSKNQEVLTIGWGTTRILRRHWDWLSYRAADGSYPNDPSGAISSQQIILSVDGVDFFADFVKDAKVNSGALLTRREVINNVFLPGILMSWMNIASNYTTEQANQVLGFSKNRRMMQKRYDGLKNGTISPIGPKALEPIPNGSGGDDDDFDDEDFDDY